MWYPENLFPFVILTHWTPQSDNKLLLIYAVLLEHILLKRPEKETGLNFIGLSRGTACESRWLLYTKQIILTADKMFFGFCCEIILTNNSICRKLFWPVATEIKMVFLSFSKLTHVLIREVSLDYYWALISSGSIDQVQ